MPQKNVRFQDNSGMMTVISFVVLAVVNYIVIRLAQAWFPHSIVMGTVDMSAHWAGIMFGSALSLLTVFFLPFVTWWEQRMKRTLMTNEMMAVFLGFNFMAIWLITRRSEIFGVGVTSWLVVLGLAVVLDLLQGAVMMWLEKWRQNN